MKMIKISDKEYFSSNELNNSTLKAFRVSPQKIGVQKTSKAFDIGKLWHAVILDQQEELEENYIFTEKLDGRSKEGKEQKKDALERNLILVDNNELKDIEYAKSKVLESLNDIDLMIDFIESEKEVAMFFDRDGVKCKDKVDAVNHDKKIIFDLKTISEIDKVNYNMKAFKYPLQADFYSYPLKDYRFIFVFIENVAPYCTKILELTDKSKHEAYLNNEFYIDLYKKWIENGKKRTIATLEMY